VTLAEPSPYKTSLEARDAGLCEIAARVRRTSIARYGATREVIMVGQSPSYVEVLRKAQKVAAFHEPVLVLGESGVGKESVAQAIHLLGPRSHKPMVSVNCPQYQEGNLTVSELFGHKKGSFTGATADRQGCFETANGGVIFLDEIGDLHIQAQVMFLRALATGEFQPLGADYTRTVNCRVVAATNRALHDLMVGEEFRHDLFFRLQYFVLKIPPLRERGNDWFLLAEHFLDLLAKKYGVCKKFSDDSLRVLESYSWPGNVRELQSLTTTAYAMSDGDRIEPDDFVAAMQKGRGHALRDGNDSMSLFERVASGGNFWDDVHKPFLQRELNRSQVRDFMRRGLEESDGSYRRMLARIGLAESDYQRFMDFLRHHRLKP
jgi:DNA-binding NtrC family response regulator